MATLTINNAYCGIAEINYGYLYNGYITTNTGSSSITSSDTWSVPTSTQLNELKTYLTNNGYSGTEGNALRATGTTYWSNSNGVDAFGFDLRGAGYRANNDGDFTNLNEYGAVWASDGSGVAWQQFAVVASTPTYIVTSDHIREGKSIRLVADATGISDGTTTTYTGNDGIIYPAIAIGGMYWTTVNLAETKYRDGSIVPEVTDNTAWATAVSDARCVWNNDESYR